jgi:hypothetical protein
VVLTLWGNNALSAELEEGKVLQVCGLLVARVYMYNPHTCQDACHSFNAAAVTVCDCHMARRTCLNANQGSRDAWW